MIGDSIGKVINEKDKDLNGLKVFKKYINSPNSKYFTLKKDLIESI
jgi:hypothetical protein